MGGQCNTVHLLVISSDFKAFINLTVKFGLKTKDDNEIGYLVLIDLKYSSHIEERIKHFPLCPQYKKVTKKILKI